MSMRHDSVMILDSGYRIAHWSRGAEALYGWSSGEAAGKDVRRLLKTRFPEPLRKVREILAAQGAWEGELENSRKDGSSVRVTCRLVLERKVRGQPATLLAVHSKIGSGRRAGRGNRASGCSEVIPRGVAASLNQVEENLRRANDRLEMAHRAAEAGTWDWDIPTGRLEWCGHLFRIFGLDPETATASFETWQGVLHPADRDVASERIEKALRDHTDLASEYRIIRPDGQVRWIDARGRGVYDDQGRPFRMTGICLDITERKKAEDQLTWLAGFPQRNPAPIVELDLDGNVLFMNPAAERLLPDLRQKRTEHSWLQDWDSFRQAFVADGTRLFVRETWLGDVCYQQQAYFVEELQRIRIYGLNISKRKQAEAELHRQREWLQVTLSSIGDAVVAGDAGGCVTFLNPVAAGLTGWEPGEAVGRPVQEVLHLVDERTGTRTTDLVRRVFQEGRVILLENHTILIARDGRRIPVEDSAAPIRDAHGSISGVVLVFHDVTEKRRAQAALKESEQLYRAVGESIDYGVWVCAPDGRNIYASDSFLKLVGQTQEQCSDFGWGDVLHPDDAERTVAAWKECVRTGGNWDIEHRYRGVDGSWHPVLARGVPVRNSRGEIVFWAGINLDISSLKQAQEALESARREAVNEKNRLEAVMEALPVGMAITDARGGTIRSNRMFEQIWGGPRPRTDNVGDYAAYKAWWADTGRAVQPEEWASSQAVREGKTVVGQMMELEGFDGSRRFVLNSAAPILDAGGNRIGSAVAIQDVTELHRIEQALKESEERLRLGQACAQVGVWDYHPRTGIIDTTPEFDQLYGLTEGPRLTYEDWTWRIHPEDLPKITEVRNRAIIDHQTFDLEFRILHPSRGERWISSKGGALYDTSGEVTRIFGVNADITERKLSEEALRNSEERYRGLYEAVAGGVVMQDQDGRIIEANPAACEMLGLTLDKVFGRTSSDPQWRPIHEDGSDFPGEDHPGTVTLRTGTPIRGVVMGVFQPAKDECRWLMINSVPIFVPGTERVQRVVTTFIDITKRKQDEAALRESEARYRTLFDSMSEGFAMHEIICGEDGAPSDYRFLDVNPAFERLTGMRKADVVGRTVSGLLPGEYRLWANAYGEVALSGKPAHFESYSPTLRRHFDVSAYSNAPRQFAVIFIDITDRKRMEAEMLEMERLKMLSESRKLWQDTFDSITDLISIHDPDGSLRRANRAFLEYFGLSAEDAAGKTWEELFQPGESAAGDNPLKQSLRNKAPASWEFTDSRRSRAFELFTFPLESGVEGSYGCIQIAKDITDRRESEIRLIVSERLAAVGQLAAGVAHEINNPLATISGCAEGLLSRIDRAYDPQETREYLQIIKEEVLRCKTITDGMLSFVRQPSYEIRPISVNEALDKDIEMMRLQGRLHNVQVMREYSPDLPRVRVREGDLRQVFLALLANALDAMDDRGILTVRTGLEEGHVFAIIKDTGTGVLPEQQDRIFDLFFTTKAQKGGTGIGLPVARKLVRSMSGQITLEPGPGPGASFRVSVPV